MVPGCWCAAVVFCCRAVVLRANGYTAYLVADVLLLEGLHGTWLLVCWCAGRRQVYMMHRVSALPDPDCVVLRLVGTHVCL